MIALLTRTIRLLVCALVLFGTLGNSFSASAAPENPENPENPESPFVLLDLLSQPYLAQGSHLLVRPHLYGASAHGWQVRILSQYPCSEQVFESPAVLPTFVFEASCLGSLSIWVYTADDEKITYEKVFTFTVVLPDTLVSAQIQTETLLYGQLSWIQFTTVAQCDRLDWHATVHQAETVVFEDYGTGKNIEYFTDKLGLFIVDIDVMCTVGNEHLSSRAWGYFQVVKYGLYLPAVLRP